MNTDRRRYKSSNWIRATLFLSLFCFIQSIQGSVETRIFDPGYLEGDCNYHSIKAASDGYIYFSVSTHQPRSSARIYRFQPQTEKTELVGDLGEILNTDVEKEIPHGKIHSELYEHKGSLYFATHTSSYDGNLPDMRPKDGRSRYPGGHFMRYDLESGQFESLAQLQMPNEGMITMTLNRATETLYSLTWPTSLLVSYQLDEKLLHNWGATQNRGEWGHLGSEWSFICRKLAVDNLGTLYGSTDTGRIWKLDTDQQRPLFYLDGLNVNEVPPFQEENFSILPEPHYYWQGWRTILWNPNTESFWGLHGGSTHLFELNPKNQLLRSVRSLRPQGIPQNAQRNPFRTQLGFMLGPNNTLLYLAHAPGIPVEGRRDLKTSVHLLSYQIDEDRFQDHGPLVTEDGRRIFFTESIELGQDGHLYTVAWVETINPSQAQKVRMARGQTGPTETDDILYEIQLVQLEKLDL